jgi:mRNA interferase MazF
VRRGEVWWAQVDERCPVVLLSVALPSEGGPPGLRAMRIVAPATADERHGFLVLSGAQAAELERSQAAALERADVRAVGVEVELGPPEGLPQPGVVRVALPRDGTIFCTWLVTLTEDALIERAGVLSPAKLGELGHALRLAGIETGPTTSSGRDRIH